LVEKRERAILFFGGRAMPFSTQFSVSCIAVLALPSIAALGVFFVTLRFWAAQILRDDSNFCERIKLIAIEDGISWKIDLSLADLPWPSNPLEWATVAALSLILVETILFGRGEPEARIVWYVAGVSAATIALSAPFAIPLFWADKVRGFVKAQILVVLSLRSSEEMDVIQEIGELGREIFDRFSALGAKTEIDPAKNCRDILLMRATGGPGNTLRRLAAVKKTLMNYLEELRSWIPVHEAARQEFDWAKNAVIGNGSATLLNELDRLRDWMSSAKLAGLLDRGRWDEALQLLNQIRFDLKMVQNAAEGGSDMPQSIGDACRLLNVNGATSNKVIKGVVDALRRVWHPDLTSDETEREKRTAKMKQINAAWEIVREARTTDADLALTESDLPESRMFLN
jgi:hypothetical protein